MGHDPAIDEKLRAAAQAREKTRVAFDEAIREASENGYSYREIAELVGISFQRVAQIISRAAV